MFHSAVYSVVTSKLMGWPWWATLGCFHKKSLSGFKIFKTPGDQGYVDLPIFHYFVMQNFRYFLFFFWLNPSITQNRDLYPSLDQKGTLQTSLVRFKGSQNKKYGNFLIFDYFSTKIWYFLTIFKPKAPLHHEIWP